MKAKQATLSILLAVALAACSNPFGGTLAGVKVEPSAISPNADGKDDLARIEYRLRQPAKVQIYLTDAAGEKHYIRHEIERAAIAKSYTILFNGIDENGRMLANGDYTWHVVANSEVISGPLTLSDADTDALVAQGVDGTMAATDWTAGAGHVERSRRVGVGRAMDSARDDARE